MIIFNNIKNLTIMVLIELTLIRIDENFLKLRNLFMFYFLMLYSGSFLLFTAFGLSGVLSLYFLI